MNQTTFIYALCEPGTRTIRYIGKANNPQQRLQRHISTSTKKNHHLGRWIRKVKTPFLLVLKEIPKNDWQSWEQCYIRNARMLGFSLVNVTEGGEGGGTMLGKQHSQETKQKMSQASKGKPKSAEHCKHNSESRIGKKLGPFSDSHCRNISASKQGQKKQMSSSNFKGVFWDKKLLCWKSLISVRGCLVYLGLYESEEDAAHVYDYAARAYFGGTAKLNFS